MPQSEERNPEQITRKLSAKREVTLSHEAGQNPSPKVAVVVLGYNSRAFLDDCFSSILASSYANLEVFFVDNHSSDGSSLMVKKQFSKVTVLEMPNNLGFAGGNNAGISEALLGGAAYVMLLNPDTILATDAVERLVSEADYHTILQPLVLHYADHKTDEVNTAGSYVQYLGISYVGNYKAKAHDMQAKSIPAASGAACLIPRSVFETVGQLDELFFMYYEDTDLCWRARAAGFEVRLVPGALVWHKYQFSRNVQKMYYIERNRCLFVIKNYQLRTLWLIVPMFVVHEIVSCLFALKEGWFAAKLRAYRDGIRLLPAMMRARTIIKRTVKDRGLKQYLSPRLEFAEIHPPLIRVYNWILDTYWRLIRGLI